MKIFETIHDRHGSMCSKNNAAMGTVYKRPVFYRMRGDGHSLKKLVHIGATVLISVDS